MTERIATRLHATMTGACAPAIHDGATPVMHDAAACTGCARLLRIPEIGSALGESVDTIYKWSSRGHPDFPPATRLPNRRIVVRCDDLRAWIAERTR